MLVIGLTGRSCAGKDRFADEFAALGIGVIDVDGLGHGALAAQAVRVAEAFGPQVMAADGSIDRKVLGKIVFGDPSQLKRLEAISHPWMVNECRRLIAEAKAAGEPAVVLNAALLYRMRLDMLCDAVVFIRVPFYTRYRRAKERDKVSWEAFRAREKAQADVNPDVFKGRIQVVVMGNDGDPALIHRQVMEFCDTMNIRMSLPQG
jgi:dephospho-CoA kinase